MKDILKFLDGKKTIIGLIMLTVAGHVSGLPAELLNIVGGSLTGVGFAHKTLKANKGKIE
ncbi:MAG: hypothetical protein OEM46_03305 [Ignavibacteria bacterium]|nr:hypothetical protein [Ignavibacteria bacterium]